jgi:SAM-dependent methyltransferase
MDLQAKLQRESAFWDARQSGEAARDAALYRVAAADRDDRSMPWLGGIGFPAHVDCMFARLGELAGRRVLDLGCGCGFVSSLLAANGALVDAVDISEASLAVARWRAKVSEVDERITFHLSPAEMLPFEDERFDAICGAFVLHHLDLVLAAPELFRVLKRGGRAAFIETSGRSAILMGARRLLTGRFGIEKASSDDEAPLAEDADQALKKVFGDDVRTDYPSTLFFRMLSYIAPLHLPPARRVLGAIDAQMHKVERLRSQSYYCVVSVSRSGEQGERAPSV